MEEVNEHSTRWTTPAPKTVRITPRVVEVLRLCDGIRYSRSSWLIAHLKKKWPQAEYSQCLKLFKAMTGRKYLKKIDTRAKLFNAAYQPDVFEITELGSQILKDAGHAPTRHPYDGGGPFMHNLMLCDIVHSISLGTELVTQDDILSRRNRDTTAIPFNGEKVYPDALIGIKTGVYRFYAIEADTGTEQISTKVRNKLAKYREAISQQAYQHFDIPNLFVLFVTNSPKRLENIRQEILDLTGGRGNSAIFLKCTKNDVWTKPEPTAHMLTEKWARAGYPDFQINV